MSTTLEREIEIYGRLLNHDILTTARNCIQQEQWGVYVSNPDGTSGNIRVRSINNGANYVLTTKVKHGDKGSLETEEPTTKAMYDAFKRLATDGLNKTRYVFPTTNEDVVYEVDVFYDGVDKHSEWVKIDIEIPAEGDVDEWLDNLPPLPFHLEDIRVIRPGKKSPEDEAFCNKLFQQEFVCKK